MEDGLLTSPPDDPLRTKRIVAYSITTVVLVVGVILWIVGLTAATSCPSGCIERSCESQDYNYHDCDCGSTCSDKDVSPIWIVGLVFVIIGIILLCCAIGNYGSRCCRRT